MTNKSRIVTALTAAGLVIALASSAQAGRSSASGTRRLPKIAATIKVLSPKSRLVHIVNLDTVPGYLFLIRSVDSPKILSASDHCVLSRSLFFILTQQHYEYRAHCRFTVAPGRAFDVRLGTRGGGQLGVVACPPRPNVGPCAF
jgi:hypothetical protein